MVDTFHPLQPDEGRRMDLDDDRYPYLVAAARRRRRRRGKPPSSRSEARRRSRTERWLASARRWPGGAVAPSGPVVESERLEDPRGTSPRRARTHLRSRRDQIARTYTVSPATKKRPSRCLRPSTPYGCPGDPRDGVASAPRSTGVRARVGDVVLLAQQRDPGRNLRPGATATAQTLTRTTPVALSSVSNRSGPVLVERSDDEGPTARRSATVSPSVPIVVGRDRTPVQSAGWAIAEAVAIRDVGRPRDPASCRAGPTTVGDGASD